MTSDPRLVRALLACYPAGWRRRYGDEYAQLLCDIRIHRRPALIVDSLCGAIRVQLAQGSSMMSTRSPMTAAVWAAGLFTVAGIEFQKLAEDVPGRAGAVYAMLLAAAAVTLLALVAAAAPPAVALLRGRDSGALKYVAVPVVGAGAWYGVVRLALAISDGHGVHSAANITGFALVAAASISVVAATAWAASSVLHRAPADQPSRVRRATLAVLAAGMAVTTVAALIWGLQVHTGDPTEFRGNHGILATPLVPSWITALVLMAGATVLATTGAGRQLVATRSSSRG